ncbi:MAG: GNAT family N-acetyltransferase [Actinomycetota bacterium]|nr:GNAT family N-acetyltransferase [Actinomycetota bacterium]
MKDELPTLRGERVVLRPLQAADADHLAGVIVQPEVARWWGSRPDDVEHHHAGLLEDAAGNHAFAIEVDGALAGWLGVDEENEPDYRHAGLDIFLDPGVQGAGHGPQALRLAARWLIEERGHHRLIIDPAAANERAIAVYASIGFRPVGLMRDYERGADGAWHDALLMDMLAHELRW